MFLREKEQMERRERERRNNFWVQNVRIQLIFEWINDWFCEKRIGKRLREKKRASNSFLSQFFNSLKSLTLPSYPLSLSYPFAHHQIIAHFFAPSNLCAWKEIKSQDSDFQGSEKFKRQDRAEWEREEDKRMDSLRIRNQKKTSWFHNFFPLFAPLSIILLFLIISHLILLSSKNILFSPLPLFDHRHLNLTAIKLKWKEKLFFKKSERVIRKFGQVTCGFRDYYYCKKKNEKRGNKNNMKDKRIGDEKSRKLFFTNKKESGKDDEKKRCTNQVKFK